MAMNDHPLEIGPNDEDQLRNALGMDPVGNLVKPKKDIESPKLWRWVFVAVSVGCVAVSLAKLAFA